jgi:NADH-quinone oxidoreductase subunit N
MEIGDISFYGLLPVITFTLVACGLTMLRSLNHNDHELHRLAGVIASVSASAFVIIASALRWRQFDTGKLTEANMQTMSGLVSIDRMSALSSIVISLLVIVTALVAGRYLEKREDMPSAEFFILLLCVAAGMVAMTMANDLLVMFVALEVFSIPLYVLTAFDRRRARSLEGGFKYFIMGAVSSAIFLYGIALHYGVSGSTTLGGATTNSTISAIAMVLISVGLLFKVASVPFHFWSPDAYQGAPSPVTMYMAAATKLTAFVAFTRLITSGVIDASPGGSTGRIVLTVACLASALFGSIVALRQSNVKRAIAYSSISHTAYILLALKAGTIDSMQAVMTYVVAYALIIAGTFAIISLVVGVNEQDDSMSALKGLASRNPYLAGSLTILLFAQAGIPLTSGFIAKFEVFRVAFEQEFYISAIIVLITTVIAAALYLRIVLSLYSDSFGEQTALAEKLDVSPGVSFAVGLCVVATIAVGIFPTLLTGLTHAL